MTTDPITDTEIENIRTNLALAEDSDDPWDVVPNYRAVSGLLAEVDRLRAENTALRAKVEEGLDREEDARGELAAGDASDGYHTHNELYEYRMLYNAHAAMGWLARGYHVVKSWKHADGEKCFGGGWFVVYADLPTGQVTNHYEAKHWGLFDLPVMRPGEYDGHTPAEAADRLRRALGGDRG